MRSRPGRPGGDAGEHGDQDATQGLGGMLRSLGGFFELVTNLAEQGQSEISRTGELGDDKKGLKAVYGVSVRMGLGGKPKVEPFGNFREARRGGPTVEEVREPMVDVFDEEDHLLVVAELPGIEAGEIVTEVKGDLLVLTASHGELRYRKEILLEAAVSPEGLTSTCRNGVLELKLRKVR